MELAFQTAIQFLNIQYSIMYHLEKQEVHLNDGQLMFCLVQKNQNTNLPSEQCKGYDDRKTDLPMGEDMNFLHELCPGKFQIECSAKEYMLQASLNLDKKLLLKTSYEIMVQYSRNHDLSKNFQNRLRRIGTEVERADSNLNAKSPQISLKVPSSNLCGKYLIFIIWESSKPGFSDIYVWSCQGQIIFLRSEIKSSQVDLQVLKEFRVFRSSLCIIINSSMTRQSTLSILQVLKDGQNEVILELPSQNPNLNYYCGQALPIKTSKNEQIWEFFSIGTSYILSSCGGLEHFSNGLFKLLRRKAIDLIDQYCNEVKSLGNLFSAPLFPQVLAIINNLIQISRSNMVQTNMNEQLWEFLDFLREDSDQLAFEKNQQFLDLIGNSHYPAKMKHCLKCRVCKKNNKLRGKENCRKSKYVCQDCSIYFDEKIHLCVTCFGKFHKKIQFFMGKAESKKIRPRNLKAPKKKSSKKQLNEEEILMQNAQAENEGVGIMFYENNFQQILAKSQP